MKLYISPSSQQANIGPGGYVEEISMNAVADILIPELERHGFSIMRNNPANTFRGHIEESNAYKPDYHIAIHSNAGGTTARGLVIFAYKPELYPNRLGPQMARSIYKYLSALTPVEDRGIKDGSENLSEVAKTAAPAVLIEIDFHDKPEGAAWILANITEIAHAILLGILEQCKVPYIQPNPKYLYRVQVGAFHNLEYAKAMQDKLTNAGFKDNFIKREEY